MPSINANEQAIVLDLPQGFYQFNFPEVNFDSDDRIEIRFLEGEGPFIASQQNIDGLNRNSRILSMPIEEDSRISIHTIDLGEDSDPTAVVNYNLLGEYNGTLASVNDADGSSIEYPLEEADYLGSAVLRNHCTELRTDRNEVLVAQLEQDFFHGQVDLSGYGVSGSAGLWTTEPGINKVTFDMRGDYDAANLLFWNGESIVPIDPAHVSNSTIEIYVDALSDEWGFVLLDSNDSSDDTDLRISGIEWVGESSITDLNGGYVANLGGITPTDSIGNAKIDGDSTKLTTGKYDRAASSLGDWTMGDKEFLKPYGTEGTAITFTDLEAGFHSFEWSFYSSDRDGNDALYAWNGKELTKIGDRTDGYQISSARWTSEDLNATVEVVYDYVTLIALDENDKRGTTDFTIENFRRTGDLGYEPPQPIDIAPDILTGDINLKDAYTGIATGTGDRAISTLGTELFGDRDALTDYGTEGSYAKWTGLDNGTYEVTWSLYASENDVDRDAIYFWDGSTAQPLATRADATIQSSATRWISERTTSTFDVTNGEFGFLALDELDKSGTTEMRIYSIEKIGG